MRSRPYKLLIIGGYGTFGGRLARLLSDEPRLTILVAGRSLHKARAFVDRLSGSAESVPVPFDRDGDVAAQVTELAPDIVVDASGPWQAYGSDPYRVAKAAILNGAHYIDLADGREFVCNIAELDEAAKQKGLFVLAGASTCPALTTAVARRLSEGLSEIASLTAGIAPSPFAGMGRSVVEAIAGYAGKPITVWRDGKRTEENTFTSTRTFTIAPPGCVPLPRMTFSLIDVPDLETLTSLEPRAGSIWFGVATLPAIYHALLRFLARGVKTGLVSSLQPLAGFMHFVMNHLGWGEHRGGMFVEVRGIDAAGRKATRSWHMVAEGDAGPFVPTMAANFIVRRCLQIRTPAPGARPAQDALTLGDYEAMFARLGISTGERSSNIPERWPLFRRVLGDAWNDLPAPIRKLHGNDGEPSFKGRATVTRGDSILSKIVARCIGFPQAADDVPVTIRIDPSGKGERWHRVFAGRGFSSELFAGTAQRSHLVCEQIGPCRFDMALVADADRLYLRPGSWALFGMPMPRYFLPSGAMYETVIEGKFSFHVEIRVPLIGHIVTYQGWFDTGD